MAGFLTICSFLMVGFQESEKSPLMPGMELHKGTQAAMTESNGTNIRLGKCLTE